MKETNMIIIVECDTKDKILTIEFFPKIDCIDEEY